MLDSKQEQTVGSSLYATLRQILSSGRLTPKQKDILYGYLFVSPQVIGFILVVLIPIIIVFYYSTQHRNLLTGVVQPAGLGNYVAMVEQDPLFMQVMLSSLIFTVGLVAMNVTLALLLAILLQRRLPGTIFFRTLFFAPVVTSAVAWAIVWRFMLQGENGVLNQVLSLVSINGPNWLREPAWAMFSVIFTRVLKNVGLNMIIFTAALQNIPKEFDEAAQVDGANVWERIRHVTLPLLSPTILVVLVLTIIGSLKVFDHIVMLTNGGPFNATTVLAYYIYFQAFKLFETGYASALAVILFIVALGTTLVQWVLRKRFVYHEQ